MTERQTDRGGTDKRDSRECLFSLEFSLLVATKIKRRKMRAARRLRTAGNTNNMSSTTTNDRNDRGWWQLNNGNMPMSMPDMVFEDRSTPVWYRNADWLDAKHGRARANLTGYRVDVSGRRVVSGGFGVPLALTDDDDGGECSGDDEVPELEGLTCEPNEPNQGDVGAFRVGGRANVTNFDARFAVPPVVATTATWTSPSVPEEVAEITLLAHGADGVDDVMAEAMLVPVPDVELIVD